MLSIVVPVYNVEKYLIRCLDSLANQTLKDIEIILVNDGSTDSSKEICQKYIQNKPQFQLYSKENGGLMSAWMYGLEKCSGDFIGFVDSDDFVAHEMYETMYQVALDKQTDVVMCTHYYIDDTGQTEKCDCPITEGLYEGEQLSSIYKNILPKIGGNYISPSRCNKIIRKSLLESNLQFCDKRISSAEDVNIIVPVEMSMKRFYYIDRPFYYYYRRQGSISGNYNPNLFDNYLLLFKKLESAANYYDHPELKNQLNRSILFYANYLLGIILNANISKKQKKAETHKVFSNSIYRRAVSEFKQHFKNPLFLEKLLILSFKFQTDIFFKIKILLR